MIYLSFSQPEIITGTAIFFMILLCAVVLLAKKKHGNPYERIQSILTPPEQRFYKALSFAVKDRAIITAKVRIADIIKVRHTIPRHSFWRHFSQISQKHIDFVLIDSQDFRTLCLIELDDKSHGRFDRIQRDRFVNQVMAQTEIPLHRFPVQRRYDCAEILRALIGSLSDEN